jgi:S-adenosylmethionine synthetase
MNKTAEYVSPKHPDKICDFISDSILDEVLRQDPYGRVAVETMGGHGQIKITGEITANCTINYEEIIKDIVGDGYQIDINIVEQSPEIATGVDNGGAGDQGIMVGYACNDNEEMIPQELYLARSLCKFIYSYFPNDGKTQITINDSKEIETIVCSFCKAGKENLISLITEWIEDKQISPKLKIYANPAGEWSVGGFDADTGVTGRKLIVDNYGPQVPIGGGAFSGKDPSKVDRSGAYVARNIAVMALRRYNANEVICKVAYAIGVKDPVMVTITIDNEKTIDIFFTEDLSVRTIITNFSLTSPIYANTAQWGPFGNGFIWDK